MLFSRDIEPRCAYCDRGAPLDGERIACPKRGIVSPEGHCPRFRYDPLRRVPPRPAVLDPSRFDREDFTL